MSSTIREAGHSPLRYPKDWIVKHKSGDKISVLTAYDATMARLLARSSVDALLVGDSLGMVVQGQTSTLPVTLDEMIYHCKLVRRGAPGHFVIGDMPFGTYQSGVDSGVAAAIRVMKEAGTSAVKFEGADPLTLEIIRRLTAAGVPVMGHTGLTPQSYLSTGGFRVQGKDEAGAGRLKEDARKLEEAGCFSMVLELVPLSLGKEITAASGIPTIGIGAGNECSGQVLVINDLLGMDTDFKPRHVKQYAGMGQAIIDAAESYCEEVRDRSFPSAENSFR